MKLNIGCGNTYKPGYINIDMYNTTVADKHMPAQNLDFPDNSIDEIIANQLIEHLGYFTTIYALAEWFRVLKPQATLYLETPDVERAFHTYLQGNHETKKNILSWIYGMESKGMSHQFCFPKPLLTDVLTKTGFTNINTSHITNKEKQPTLRVTCQKTKEPQCSQIIASYRKTLRNAKIGPAKNHALTLEQEKLIDFFATQINQLKKNNSTTPLDEITINGSIRSPTMTKLLLETCSNHHLLQKKQIQHHIETAEILTTKKFPHLLISLLRNAPNTPGTQKKTFETTYVLGKQYAKKVLTATKKSQEPPSEPSVKHEDHGNMPCFFSAEIITQEAARIAYQAIKEFTLSNYDDAIKKLQKATQLERNRLLYYWNLARLLNITENKKKATIYYTHALTLIELSNKQGKKELEKTIKREMKQPSSPEYNQPITEVVL